MKLVKSLQSQLYCRCGIYLPHGIAQALGRLDIYNGDTLLRPYEAQLNIFLESLEFIKLPLYMYLCFLTFCLESPEKLSFIRLILYMSTFNGHTQYRA